MTDVKPAVLIVEEEAWISFEIEELALDLGYRVIGPARNVATALQLVAGDSPDVAILDINIGGESSFAVADELTRQGKPFLFLTGYHAEFAREAYAHVPVMTKPFDEQQLASRLAGLLHAPRA